MKPKFNAMLAEIKDYVLARFSVDPSFHIQLDDGATISPRKLWICIPHTPASWQEVEEATAAINGAMIKFDPKQENKLIFPLIRFKVSAPSEETT